MNHSPAPGRDGILPAGWFASPSEEERPVGWLFLLLVTALAALVRFYRLDGPSLWADELATWRMCRPDAGLHFWEQIRDMIQGPLYLAAVWPLVRLGGSEFLLRLPAACAGAVTVPLLALLGWRLFGTRTARLVALLAALSPFHVWYSQEARGYAFLMFFATAMLLLFVVMVQNRARIGFALLFALFSAGAVWSNLSALFLWAALGLTLLAMFRPASGREWGFWVVAFAGGMVAAAPWLLEAAGVFAVDRLLPGAVTGEALRGETTFTPLAWPYTAFAFLYGHSLGPSLRELHQPDRLAAVKAAWPIVLPAGLVGAIAILAGLGRLRRRQWALLLWLGVPVLLVSILATRNVKPFNARYLAAVFPLWLLLLSCGLARMPRRWGVGLSVLVLGFFLWSLYGHFFNPRYAKDDIRGVAARIAQQAMADEPVLVPVAAGVFQYYHHGPQKVIGYWGGADILTREAARDFLDRRLAGAESCWIVLTRQWRFDPQGWIVRVVEQQGEILWDESLTGVRLLRWRRAPGRE
jgi:4-amino-4-deoxy-L-arabinose transferase-like glycosyltransferase